METPAPKQDTLLNILRIEKETFWTQHSCLPSEDIQQLWSARAEQLTSVLGPSAPTNCLDLGNPAPYPRRRAVHDGHALPAMVRRRSDHRTPENLDHEESFLRHAAPSMSRKRSSDSRTGPKPFSANGIAVPPLTINTFQANNDEPFSNYTIKMRRTASGRVALQRVPEIATFDPAEYCSKLPDTTNVHLLPATPPRPLQHPRRLSLSPLQESTFAHASPYVQSPATPMTGGLTNATTYTSGMSRQSSVASSSLCGGIDMMRLNSHTSDISNFSMGFEPSPTKVKQSLVTPNNCDNSVSENDRSHFLDHTGGVVNDSEVPNLSITPVMSAPLVPISLVEEELKMSRSISSESNASAQSRASRRRQEQLAQSSRPIAPKPFDDELSMSRRSSASSHQMIRIRSEDGSSKEVVPISKALYLRPTYDKVKCSKCNEQPDGFRGEHELRRHTERSHCTFRKIWVCVDISPDKTFLANCKACRHNKKYGAYYNAAAHLRRAHFNPKTKGRKGKPKAEDKRGGIGGGNYPSMEILKMWMREEEEFVPENMDDDATIDKHLDEPTLADLFSESQNTEAAQPHQSSITAPSSLDRKLASCETSFDALSTVQTLRTPKLTSSAPAQPQPFTTPQQHVSQNILAIGSSDSLELSLDVNLYDQSFDDSHMLFDMSPLEQSFIEQTDEFDGSNLFP